MHGIDPSSHLKADHLAASARDGVDDVADRAEQQREAAVHRKGDSMPRGRRWWRFWKR